MSGQRQRFLKHYAADLPVFEELAPMLDRFFADKPEASAQFRRPFQAPAAGGSHVPFWAVDCAQCEMGPGMQRQLAVAAAVLAARGELEPGGKVPEKLIAQAVKEIVMHEVGHTLGLRHNFKASSIYTPEADQRSRVHRQARQQRLGDGLPAGQHRPARARSKAITSRPPSALTTTGPSNTPISRSMEKAKEKEELAKIAGQGFRSRAGVSERTKTPG